MGFADELKRFPQSLGEAIDRFKTCDAARCAFGAGFVNHHAGMKKVQLAEFDQTVTDWEIRYLLVSS